MIRSYNDHAANERTFLAWIRTGLSTVGLGLPIAHFVAAAGAVLGIALTWGRKLQSGAGVDLAPSMHWRAPVLVIDAGADRGPVLVAVEYRIAREL
jgi:hypothetical protein